MVEYVTIRRVIAAIDDSPVLRLRCGIAKDLMGNCKELLTDSHAAAELACPTPHGCGFTIVISVVT